MANEKDWWLGIKNGEFLDLVGKLTHTQRLDLLIDIQNAVRRTTTRPFLEHLDEAERKQAGFDAPVHRGRVEALLVYIHNHPPGAKAPKAKKKGRKGAAAAE